MQDGTEDRVQNPPVLRLDPLYMQTVGLMQEGRWREAAGGLAALEQRFPGSPELETTRHHLSLHLSAEESWAPSSTPERGRPEMPGMLEMPAVRLLLAANVLLYLLLACLLVLARLGPSSH